ncbi:hypothetical protein FB451DRAFT_1176856 [Mycena latifolia]|nr:hypothetical protein FB451DRAFT_1176856 [Mycena latifolia]
MPRAQALQDSTRIHISAAPSDTGRTILEFTATSARVCHKCTRTTRDEVGWASTLPAAKLKSSSRTAEGGADRALPRASSTFLPGPPLLRPSHRRAPASTSASEELPHFCQVGSGHIQKMNGCTWGAEKDCGTTVAALDHLTIHSIHNDVRWRNISQSATFQVEPSSPRVRIFFPGLPRGLHRTSSIRVWETQSFGFTSAQCQSADSPYTQVPVPIKYHVANDQFGRWVSVAMDQAANIYPDPLVLELSITGPTGLPTG